MIPMMDLAGQGQQHETPNFPTVIFSFLFFFIVNCHHCPHCHCHYFNHCNDMELQKKKHQLTMGPMWIKELQLSSHPCTNKTWQSHFCPHPCSPKSSMSSFLTTIIRIVPNQNQSKLRSTTHLSRVFTAAPFKASHLSPREQPAALSGHNF